MSDCESLPIGTESLLGRLGYTLDARLGEWVTSTDPLTHQTPQQYNRLNRYNALLLDGVPQGEAWFNSEKPDRLHAAAAARMSDISPEEFSVVIDCKTGSVSYPQAVPMTPDQIRFRKHQAIDIGRYGERFFKGEK